MCKLKETLQELKGWNIKVGSQVSFFYCGPCDRNIISRLTKLSDKHIESLKREITKKEKKLNDLDDLFEKKVYAYKHPKEAKHTKKEIADYVKKATKIREKNKDKLTKEIYSLKQRIIKYVPFLERKVIYVVDGISADEPHTKVIKIKGNEVSKFWTIKEYEHFKKTGKMPVKDTKVSKLDTDIIYKQATSGKYSGKEICNLYGISRTTLTKILNNKRAEIIAKKGYMV